jgi:hypothetical protein
MSKQRRAATSRERRAAIRQRTQPPRRRGLRWPIIITLALAVLAAAALILLGQSGQGGGERPASLPSSGNVLGDPNAPVMVDEWGDFQ